MKPKIVNIDDCFCMCSCIIEHQFERVLDWKIVLCFKLKHLTKPFNLFFNAFTIKISVNSWYHSSCTRSFSILTIMVLKKLRILFACLQKLNFIKKKNVFDGCWTKKSETLQLRPLPL